MGRIIDETGNRYERLLVLRKTNNTGKGAF